MLYLATTSTGAFGESIARRRPNLESLARAGVAGVPRPIVSASWRQARRLGVTVLTVPLPFVDVALEVGLPDVDLSAVTGPSCLSTQEAARYIYEQRDTGGGAMLRRGALPLSLIHI